MKWNDVLTLTVSMLALLVSVLTTYYTIVRQADDLNVIVDSVPAVNVAGNQLKLGNASIVLMNDGNRPAVVNTIWLYLEQKAPPASSTGSQKACASNSAYAVDITPISVKENAVVPFGSSIRSVARHRGRC